MVRGWRYVALQSVQSRLDQPKEYPLQHYLDAETSRARGEDAERRCRDGAKMVREFSKLILRAYNNEADNATTGTDAGRS